MSKILSDMILPHCVQDYDRKAPKLFVVKSFAGRLNGKLSYDTHL